MISKLFIFFNFTILALLLTLSLVTPKFVKFDFPENKIWAHRQNDLSRIKMSLNKNVSGLEMDLWFTDNGLRLGHDQASELTLSDALDYLRNNSLRPYLWFDLKNLSIGNETAIAESLQNLITSHQLEGQVFVESKKPWAMLRLCQGRINCSLWYYPNSSLLKKGVLRVTTKLLLVSSQVIGFSMDYRDYKKEAWDLTWPIFLFTFKKEQNLNEYKNNSNVKIILQDF